MEELSEIPSLAEEIRMSMKAEIQEKIAKIGREKFLRVQRLLRVTTHAGEHLEAFRKRMREEKGE